MKRIMRVVLSAMMVFSVISVNVHAEEENVELSQLTTDDGLFEYELSSTGITITGFNSTESVAIEIPDEIDGDRVTAIKEKAFNGCPITSVTIPYSVKTIGYNAFSNCSKLTSVTIEDGVETIGDSAFRTCWNLKSVTIAGSVKSIGEQCFWQCNNLSSVKLSEGLESIGMEAFAYCGELQSINIPKSVSSIGSQCFRVCKKITNFTLPEGLKSIEERTFANCTGLTSITIPESVVSIGSSAFQKTGLKSIKIPKGVTTIGERLFAECDQLVDVQLHDKVTSIEEEAFYNCESLKSIMIPKSVTSIADNAFEDCSKLTNIHGEKDSFAESFAKNNGKNFIAICVNHVWDAGVIHTQPSCKSIGLRIRMCTKCGETKDEVLPVTSHSFNIYDKCTKCTKYAAYISTSVPKMTVKSISKAKGALTVKWKKNTKVKGYQVRYSLKSNMSSAKTVKITKNKTTSKKISKLKKKTKYYVQIRAYQTIGGKTMYSPWSAVKSQTTK